MLRRKLRINPYLPRPKLNIHRMANKNMTTIPKGALSGLKVIDLSRVLGGPFCTQILADHGADVIKVEPPQGDETREWGPPFQDGVSAYFSGINRNKRSLALDISKPQGREILLKLLENADILIENFKPGTMEKWGLGFEDILKQRFPRLIHCRVTGFGSDGPLGGFPGYDAMVQAWAGLVSVNGSPTGGPVRVGLPLVDLSTGMNCAIGILSALYERQRSGIGQFLEVTLYDTAVTLQHPHAPNWLMSGQIPKLNGNAHPNIVPYDNFSAKDRNVVIGAGNDAQFRKLCTTLGHSALGEDPRFKTNKDRNANRDALTAILTPLIAEQQAEELATRLMASGVPAGVVMDIPDVLQHPHTKHRDMVVDKDGYRGTGIPIKFSRTPGQVRTKPPQFGGANREILREYGWDDTEIDQFIADQVVPSERRKS